MSRAIRRQQQNAPKETASPRRGFGLSKKPAPTRGARPPAPQGRRRLRIGRPSWMDDIISELKKVTWPSWTETRYLTMVVIIVAVVVGAALGIIDIFFNWLIDRLLLR
jgi:preprotein translocase subunit SecE